MSADIIPHAPTNHVLVDVENMKTIDVSLLGQKHLVFHLFFGPDNKKLDIVVVEALLNHAHSVRMIRSPKSGKNALDFVLAYHLGQAALAEPKAHFHIISKDGGFDSLIELLKSKQIKAKRHADWNSLHLTLLPKGAPPPAATASKSLSPGADKVLQHLKKTVSNRPKKKATLVRQAKSYMGKDASDSMAEKLVEELHRSGYLSLDAKGGVTYTI